MVTRSGLLLLPFLLLVMAVVVGVVVGVVAGVSPSSGAVSHTAMLHSCFLDSKVST